MWNMSRAGRGNRGEYRAWMAALIAAAVAGVGCATGGTPAMPGAITPVASIDTRVSWILRLEQQRILRDAQPPAPVDPTAPAAATPRTPPATAPGGPVVMAPAREPDLALLLRDSEPAIRARAATAVGRVGIVDEGTELLRGALADPEEVVRANAAFGLGLLGSRDAVADLLPLLADPSFTVRARAVDALGLIGDATAAASIVAASGDCPAWFASLLPDDEEYPKTPEVIEVCRSALYALVRLRDFDALARLTLDADGRPVSHWWPVAWALQRIDDPRALPALRNLATSAGVYTTAIALRGLAARGDAEALARARELARSANVDFKVRTAAIALVGRVGGSDDASMLVEMLFDEPPGSPLALQIVDALGELRQPDSFNVVLDGLASPQPAMRAAALRAAARIDPDGFLFALSGLGRDRDWSVRAALAEVLADLPPAAVTPALVDLSDDEDARVHPAALRALAAVKVPDLAERLRVALQAADYAERATAAELVAEAKLPDAVALLDEAYTRGQTDTAYAARMAAVEAIARFGTEAEPTLRRALADRDWAVRARAASLLRELGIDAEPLRPAPLRVAESFFSSDALLHPAYSPRAFIETRRGIIEVALDLVAAPVTVATFVEQVRSGMFNGLRIHRLIPGFVIQTGDPRGDGTGGPGYTQRDELSPVPFLRGSIGMARAAFETAGSQWFITTAPQPHLDARYTNFGRVVGGWEVLDQLAPGDVIERVRIWDGFELR